MSSLLPRKWHHSVCIRDAYKQFYLVLKQGRGLIFIGSNSKGQIDFINPWKSKDIYVPHALENSLMMFDPQNYECLIPLNKGFFQGHFGLTRCILFHSFHS